MMVILKNTGCVFALILIVFVSFGGALARAELDEVQIRSMRPKVQGEAAKEVAPSRGLYDLEAASLPVSAVEEEAAVDVYQLGAGDMVAITVAGEPSLSKSYTVGGAGVITLPLIGDVAAAGLSLAQVEHKVTAMLADGYLIDPRVSASIAAYRPFVILGEVENPGRYDFVSGLSVLQAVELAGGFTGRAERRRVELLRTRDQQERSLRDYPVAQEVLPGDIVLVKQKLF